MSDTRITPEAREAALNEVANAHKRLPCLQHPTGYFVAEAITRATADAQERIAELERERDSAVLSTHRQAMCINDCAAHIGPETSATIKGLPKAVKHLAAERDSLRAELETVKRERDEVQSQFSLTCAQVVALASKLCKYERPEELCEQVSKAQEQIEAVPNRIATLERELAGARRQTEMDTVRFAEMQKSGAELEVANASLQQQVAALSERNSKLQAILKEAARELENASAQAKNVEWCQHYDGWARECTKLLACDRPPEGWVCTRGYGHLGPCAALTTQEPREKGGAA